MIGSNKNFSRTPICNASKEEILNADRSLSTLSKCPLCEQLGVQCFISDHVNSNNSFTNQATNSSKVSPKNSAYLTSCEQDWVDTNINGKFLIRLFSILVILVSLTEIVVGCIAFVFIQNVRLGAWWVGILPFIAGCCGANCANKGVLKLCIALASIGIVPAVVGTILDAISAYFFTMLDTCYSTKKNHFYGHEGKNFIKAAQSCAIDNKDAEYISPNSTFASSTSLNYCDCVTENGGCDSGPLASLNVNFLFQGCKTIDKIGEGFSCYKPYHLSSKYENCSDMFGDFKAYYVELLSATAALAAALVVLQLILSILGCIGLTARVSDSSKSTLVPQTDMDNGNEIEPTV